MVQRSQRSWGSLNHFTKIDAGRAWYTQTDMSSSSPLKTALSSQQPAVQAQEALARANSNVGRNVYLALDRERVLAEAEALTALFPEPAQRPQLFGVPIGVKDCFDVAGYPTTCGSHFYAAQNGIATADSAVAARLRQ